MIVAVAVAVVSKSGQGYCVVIHGGLSENYDSSFKPVQVNIAIISMNLSENAAFLVHER